MQLTLDQALQKGIEAHKAGRVQEADRCYTAILKANPKHPDANHNMGVLAVGIGKVEVSLQFFKTALEVNPSIAQYWQSYIEALIKLGRKNEARIAFNKIKDKLKSHVIEQLESTLFTSQDKKFQKETYSRSNNKLSNTASNNKPTSSHLNSLTKLYMRGDFKETLSEASKLLKKFPKSEILFNIRGASYASLGQFRRAHRDYLKAVKINPKYANTYNNMGIAFQNEGHINEAIKAFKKSISINSDYCSAYTNLGNCLCKLGNYAGGVDAYNNALKINPHNAETYNGIGIALKEQGKFDEAMRAYRRAININPKYATAFLNLGNALQEQGKFDEAIQEYSNAIKFRPNYAEAYYCMGNSFLRESVLEKAIFAYKKAIEIKPNYAQAKNNLGTVLEQQAKFEEARNNYSKAVELDPNYAEAFYNLSNLKTFKTGDPQISQFHRLHSQLQDTDKNYPNICFALAKIYDDLEDFVEAYRFYSEGNKIRKRSLGYSIENDKVFFSKLRESQAQLYKNTLVPLDRVDALTPIFIVGMPRSGTTLVEQIISAHSEVTGAGELKYIAQFGRDLAMGSRRPSTNNILTFKENYIASLNKHAFGKRFVTDKMPQNFLYVALICAAFPMSKIIHVQRDPKATCWSNFKYNFVSGGLGYSNDLGDIVEYYKLYSELFNCWNNHYPSNIYNLDYEKLTEDPESSARSLINFLEIRWEDPC